MAGQGRSPDYLIEVGSEGREYSKRVGIAYKGESGNIELRIDPGIYIGAGYKVHIKLVPYTKQKQSSRESDQELPPGWP